MDDTLNRILSLLKKNHIAKGKFLSDLNLDKSAISEWTRGTTTSYLKYLPQIAAYFDVSIDWLVGNEQKNKPAAKSDELDSKSKRVMELFESLNPANKEIALAHIAAMLDVQDKK